MCFKLANGTNIQKMYFFSVFFSYFSLLTGQTHSAIKKLCSIFLIKMILKM